MHFLRPLLPALGICALATAVKADPSPPAPNPTTSPADTAALPKVAPRIEVAFLLDATGSMEPYIAQARSRVRAIAEELAGGTPKPDVRFALVTYRDKGDAFVTQVRSFTKSIDSMGSALSETQAAGGGDTPEAVLEGLRDAVTKLDWTPPGDDGVVRLIYLVGDAPPQHYADGPTEAWITSEARRRHIAIHAIVCGSDVKAVEPQFEAMARHSEGRVFHLDDSTPSRLRAGAGSSGDRQASSLAAALTDTTKAYSSSIGVQFGGSDSVAVTAAPLAAPAVATTGLLGRAVRWVRDEATWRDVWSAHTSLLPSSARPALPAVDFAHHEVLVLGGSDGGLDLQGVALRQGRHVARIKPAPRPGAQMFLVDIEATEGAK